MATLGSGNIIITFTILFCIIASYAVFFSAFLPASDSPLLRTLAEDTHYKYFAILIIPTTSYFVIANWVGWQYYSNS
ncbi:hypothetical protein Agabi119p4_3119 [Agaricus bisporus var. burnettii]|uniref:Uncharacterized protein n=1 Tax=Agaricus bisporus var. burnettii TaxID=192524 RepID=A0A8H7F6L3_AGABI|nr:hypothetical protein AGABI2DRAFT_199555 [Agaricus bisporus var. bisporus H97]EKV50135.1 hypothetical protein AGABI2DRAFT_199555 [Agaricus bisporus var. bisporus H97]KAF7778774.1 hypothetical protein Agabi119p4_3119 [Agaricus bisporus var. burnettii]